MGVVVTRHGSPRRREARPRRWTRILAVVVFLAVHVGPSVPGPTSAGAPWSTSTSVGSAYASTPPATTPPGFAPTVIAPTVIDGERIGLSLGDSLSLQPYASGFRRPVDVEFRPGRSEAYVVEQGGTVWQVSDDGSRRLFLDLSGRIASRGERGLLGLAFPPDGSDAVFVHYTDRRGDGVVARIAIVDGVADAPNETPILTLEQPYPNHNGGDLAFGPDGFLYVAFGDGGSANDPLRAGRDLTTWLGKILRIDVAAGGPGYAVPSDNPYATGGGRPEIWASGLRNPWRMAFDGATGDLWIGDVGQNRFEEIDVVPAGASGLDFGWSAFEGHERFHDEDVDRATVTFPVVVYGHDAGLGRSVTGGLVYRGRSIQNAWGAYLFADFVAGTLMAWLPSKPDELVVLGDTGMNVSAFAEMPDGEVLIVDHAGGAIWQLGSNAP